MSLINNMILKTRLIESIAQSKEDNVPFYHLTLRSIALFLVLLCVVLFCAFMLKTRYEKGRLRRQIEREMNGF